MTEPASVDVSHRRGRRRKILVTAVIITLCIAIGIAYETLIANQPTEGTVVHTPAVTDTTPPAQYTSLATAYYTTKYPSRYSLQPKPAQSASLDAEVLTAHQAEDIGTSSRLNLVVTALPAGGVTEDSSYKLFTSQPGTYAITPQALGADSVYVATRTSPDYQTTVLWPHGGYLLTVNLTASGQSAVTDGELQSILTNLRWM